MTNLFFPPSLSCKQRDIVGHLVNGLSNEGIARNIGTTPATISQMLKPIYRAYGLIESGQYENLRTLLVRKACRLDQVS